MRIKVVNLPSFKGYVWCEVAAGASFIGGIVFSLYPF